MLGRKRGSHPSRVDLHRLPATIFLRCASQPIQSTSMSESPKPDWLALAFHSSAVTPGLPVTAAVSSLLASTLRLFRPPGIPPVPLAFHNSVRRRCGADQECKPVVEPWSSRFSPLPMRSLPIGTFIPPDPGLSAPTNLLRGPRITTAWTLMKWLASRTRRSLCTPRATSF